MAYSIIFCRKVLESKVRAGLILEKTAFRFGLSKSSVSCWAKRLEAGRTRNKPATKIDLNHLRRDEEQHPDAYQHERAERFGCSKRGIGEALKRLKIRRKKLLFHRKTEGKTLRLFKKKQRLQPDASLADVLLMEAVFQKTCQENSGRHEIFQNA